MSMIAAVGILVFCAPGVASQGWIKYEGNPLGLKSEAGWDSEIIAVSVLKEEGMYRMWYSGYNSTLSGIGMATSVDGVHWEKYEGNPLIVPGPGAYDSDFIFAPTVVKDQSGYKMWYTGSDEASRWTIELATSLDGVNWVKHDDNPVLQPGPEWYDGERAGDPWVLHDGGIYKMWYTCQNRPEITYGIAYATSVDGIEWTKHPENPVLIAGDEGPDSDSVRDPCVVKTGAKFEMWYRGIKEKWTTCYADSPDGVNWQRYAQNPVLSGEAGGWDARVWFPRLLVEENKYSMWYTSADINDIGYAYLTIDEGLVFVSVAGIACVLCRRSVLLAVVDLRAEFR